MDDEVSFEAAYSRLEEILEKMNSGAINLDESLRLFEEANGLIQRCAALLNNAEQKIDILIKNRNGELQLTTEQRPITQAFQTAAAVL